MKFGIFYEISVPRPWTDGKEKQVYDNCLEQVRLADELGFNNVWAVEDFKIVDNGDGTRTYFFLADDIQRGIDIFTWTGPTNFPSQARAVAQQLAAEETGVAAGDAGLLVLGLIVLPAAARIGRRRRVSR